MPRQFQLDAEVNACIALQRDERRKSQGRIGFRIHDDDQFAAPFQEFVDTEVFDVAAIGQVDFIAVLIEPAGNFRSQERCYQFLASQKSTALVDRLDFGLKDLIELQLPWRNIRIECHCTASHSGVPLNRVIVGVVSLCRKSSRSTADKKPQVVFPRLAAPQL